MSAISESDARLFLRYLQTGITRDNGASDYTKGFSDGLAFANNETLRLLLHATPESFRAAMLRIGLVHPSEPMESRA